MLTGQAARAFETIEEDSRKDFDAVIEILTVMFETEAKQLPHHEKLLAHMQNCLTSLLLKDVDSAIFP